MGRLSRLSKNTALIMIGNASSKILAIIMLPFYTSWLSVEDFGTTDLITVYATFLIGIASGCIAEAIFVIPKGQKECEKKKYFTSGTLYLLASLSLVALMFYGMMNLFCYFNIHNSFIDNVWFIYLVMATNVGFLFLQQFCRAIDKISIYSFSGLIVTGTTAAFSFGLIPSYGVYGFVLSNIFAYLTACLFIIYTTKSYNYFQLSDYRWEYVAELLKYSIPLVPNAIMWWLVSASNRPLLETYCGVFSIGILAVAYKFPGFMNFLLGAFNTSWLISVLEEYKKDDFHLFFNKGIYFFAFILITASCVLTIFSKTVVELFTTNEAYFSAWIYIPILALSTVFSCMSGIIGSAFSAERKSKYYFYSSVWASIIAIIGNITLIPPFGIWGAVIANLISMATMLLCRAYFVQKFMNIRLTHAGKYGILLLFFVAFFLATLFLQNKIYIISLIVLSSMYLYTNRDIIRFVYFKTVNSSKSI